MIITNAIYFKGMWQTSFKKQNTAKADFHLLDNHGTKQVDMMSGSLQVRKCRFDNFSMVELPYKGNDVVMIVLLPHNNSAKELAAVRQLP